MDEMQESAARRLIDGYAEERAEERRRVLFDFVATALDSQRARFADGIQLAADLLAYSARRWRGVDDAEHARHLEWSNAIQEELAALFVERGASFPQVLVALAHFEATMAFALREPGDAESHAASESAPEGLDR